MAGNKGANKSSIIIYDKREDSVIQNDLTSKKIIQPLFKYGIVESAIDDKISKGDKLLVICGSQVEIYERKLKRNPEYFKDELITSIIVLSDADYAVLIRKKYYHLQMTTPEQIVADERIASLGITINQNLTIS